MLHLLQGILVVPLGPEVQVDPVDQVGQWWGIQVGHELQVYQVYQAHLSVQEHHQIQIVQVIQGPQGSQDLLLVLINL